MKSTLTGILLTFAISSVAIAGYSSTQNVLEEPQDYDPDVAMTDSSFGQCEIDQDIIEGLSLDTNTYYNADVAMTDSSFGQCEIDQDIIEGLSLDTDTYYNADVAMLDSSFGKNCAYSSY